MQLIINARYNQWCSYFRLRHLLPIEVSPLLLLLHLVCLMLSLVHLHHLPLPLPQLRLVLHHHLPVGLLLHGPQFFLIFFLLLRKLSFQHLLLSLRLDVLLLVGSQPLEVVGHVSVTRVLACCGCGVFCHEVAGIYVHYLKLILSLLILLPLFLPLALLQGQTLIFLLESFHLLSFFHGHFIFHHASHAV